MNRSLPVDWLCVSGAIEMLAACILGWLMLVPMQPWGKRFAPRRLNLRDVLAVRLDLVMLSLIQLAAAFLLAHFQVAFHARAIAAPLIVGGGLNPGPYLVRAAGINAFAFAGNWKQRLAASISGASSLSLLMRGV